MSPSRTVSGGYQVREPTGPVVPFRFIQAAEPRENGEVALFFFPGELADRHGPVQELLRNRAERLRVNPHPLFLNVLAIGQENGNLFLVEERPRGETLLSRIRERRKSGNPFAPGEALVICWLISRAVQTLHRFTVHGFLNPQEIFLEPWEDGPISWYPKIAHAGLRASLRLSSMAFEGLDQEACFFAAPEFTSQETLTEATDSHGMGALLYSMLTLRPPTGCFVRPTKLHHGLPESLDRFLLQAMEEDPLERDGSSTAFSILLKEQAGPEMNWEEIDAGERRLVRVPRGSRVEPLSMVRWPDAMEPEKERNGSGGLSPRVLLAAFLVLLSLILIGYGLWNSLLPREEGGSPSEEIHEYER